MQSPGPVADAFVRQEKSFLCVASTHFENNNAVGILPIEYGKKYITVIMLKAEAFWEMFY